MATQDPLSLTIMVELVLPAGACREVECVGHGQRRHVPQQLVDYWVRNVVRIIQGKRQGPVRADRTEEPGFTPGTDKAMRSEKPPVPSK